MRLSKRRAKALMGIIASIEGVWSTLGDEWECISGLSSDEKKATKEALEWTYNQAFKRLKSKRK